MIVLDILTYLIYLALFAAFAGFATVIGGLITFGIAVTILESMGYRRP